MQMKRAVGEIFIGTVNVWVPISDPTVPAQHVREACNPRQSHYVFAFRGTGYMDPRRRAFAFDWQKGTPPFLHGHKPFEFVLKHSKHLVNL